MTLTNLLVQVLSGVLGSNLAAEVFRNLDVGRAGSFFAGIVGGLAGGRFLQYLIGTATGSTADDPPNILISLVGGIVGGSVLMIFLGWIANRKGVGH